MLGLLPLTGVAQPWRDFPRNCGALQCFGVALSSICNFSIIYLRGRVKLFVSPRSVARKPENCFRHEASMPQSIIQFDRYRGLPERRTKSCLTIRSLRTCLCEYILIIDWRSLAPWRNRWGKCAPHRSASAGDPIRRGSRRGADRGLLHAVTGGNASRALSGRN